MIFERGSSKQQTSNDYNEQAEREKKAREKQVLISKNQLLEERVRILESYGSNEEYWYSGQPAQKMCMNQARTKQAKAIKFQKVEIGRAH